MTKYKNFLILKYYMLTKLKSQKYNIIMEKKSSKFVHFQFVDILGKIKEKLVPESIYKKYLDTGLAFDGSSVKGYTDITKSDLMLIPDKEAIFEISKNKTIILCEADYITDSRKILKNAVSKAKEKGFDIIFGTELEFFLFEKDNGKVILDNLDNKKYLSSFSKKVTSFFESVLPIFEKLNFNIECVHHEGGNNQYELDFKFDSALKTADKIIIIKEILKDNAEKHSLYVSFMPKPFIDMAGNGMHINLSIFKNKQNLFNNDLDNGLSDLAKNFMAGIIKHIKAITALSNPTINSYKRLHSGFEAPNKIGFSELDRSLLFRVPKAKGIAKRIELRSPDILANPYLTFATIIVSGLNGIENNLDIKTIENKSYYKSKSVLPLNLGESLKYLKRDKLLNENFGEFIKVYIKEKNEEIRSFNSIITDWEYQNYL